MNNEVEGMWEEMVAYLSVPCSYLKGVQKTSRSCCCVVCCQQDTNDAPPSTSQNSNLAMCCDMPFNQHAVSISLMNEKTQSHIM